MKINTNAAYEVPVLLKRWMAGEKYADALAAGNAEKWRKFYDGLADRVGFGPADSFKEAEGKVAFTIETPPDEGT